MKILIWTGFRNDVGGQVEQIIDLDNYNITEEAWDSLSKWDQETFIINNITNMGFVKYDEQGKGLYE